jgi:hypothetical protein
MDAAAIHFFADLVVGSYLFLKIRVAAHFLTD